MDRSTVRVPQQQLMDRRSLPSLFWGGGHAQLEQTSSLITDAFFLLEIRESDSLVCVSQS